jgi:hypothetical protein
MPLVCSFLREREKEVRKEKRSGKKKGSLVFIAGCCGF